MQGVDVVKESEPRTFGERIVGIKKVEEISSGEKVCDTVEGNVGVSEVTRIVEETNAELSGVVESKEGVRSVMETSKEACSDGEEVMGTSKK